MLSTGSKFEINSKFNMQDDLSFLDDEKEDGCDENEYSGEPIVSPWEHSFVELKAKMTKIPDVQLFKRIVKEGWGTQVAKDVENCCAVINYSAYFEKETEAFDSTFLMGKPKVLIMGSGEVLQGLELAVKTMIAGEESQFIIGYELLFGEMGCPPRIKPKADALFCISLVKLTDTGNDNALNMVNSEDRYKFSQVMPKAKQVNLRAKECFKRYDYHNASKLFHKAVQSVESCRLSNQEEQEEQKDFCIKTYTNLAVCYNKINLPKKTCLMCNELRRMSNIDENCKALFMEGRALLQLGEFKRAQQRLKQAHRLQPNHVVISNELRLLDEKYQAYIKHEKNVWKKVFGNNDDAKEKEETSLKVGIIDVTDPFREATMQGLDLFKKNGNLKRMQLPDGLTEDEIDCVRDLIKEFEIKLQVTDINDKKIYTLLK